MFKTIMKIGAVWAAMEACTTFGRGYMLGCMQVDRPDAKEEYDYWHDVIETGSEMGGLYTVQAAVFKFGEDVGKFAMKRALES